MMPRIICKGARNKGFGADAVTTGMQIGGAKMPRYIENWAKREIDLQLKECRNDWYTKNVLKCAYDVYKKLCRQDHSGMSIQLVKSVLDRLIDLKPLSPIEGKDDEWADVTWDDSRAIVYQNKRYTGLFKNVYEDGTVIYNDVDRWLGYDDKGICFSCGAVNKFLDRMYPITLPYYPITEKVYVKEFLADKKNGDFDTMMWIGGWVMTIREFVFLAVQLISF